MYKILGADQKEYGPVSAEAVCNWIAERRANAQTLIQAEGSTEWKPLSTFPEFSGVLRLGPAIPARGPPPIPRSPTGPARTKTSGMAIASLVLGILGLFSCGIASLVGLVLGIVSLVKIRKSKGELRGNGVAITGICLSAVFTLFGLALGAALLLPAFAQSQSRARSFNSQPQFQGQSQGPRLSCVNNLQQIGLAARLWANDHNDTFPPDFLSMSNEIVSPTVLICPGDTRRNLPAGASWSQLTSRNITYEYLKPGLKEDSSMMNSVIFRCPIHGTVCYGDGSVLQHGRDR
jgi:hypothetical protein